MALVALLAVASGTPIRAQTPETPADNSRTRSADDRVVEAAQAQPEVPSPFQLRQTPQLVSQPGAVDPKVYRLGPGDLLQLDLWGRVARSIALEVSPEGKIFVPGSGPLLVAGRTLQWAQDKASEVVGKTFRGVSADMRLVRLRTFKVYVAGNVARPGAFDVTSVTRASEALVRAGMNASASRRNVELRHLDGGTARVDLQLFEATGRQDLDPTLMDGDVLTVRTGKDFVFIYGAVASAGPYEIVEGDSLAGLLELAGGLVSSASRDSGLLVRFAEASASRESLHVDLGALLAGHWDITMRDGDRFFVYYQRDYHVLPTVDILGEVNRPGSYPIILGQDRLSDLIRWADGFGPRANKSAIYVLRAPESVRDEDPEFDRLSRLSRDQMTASEYVAFQTKLAQRHGSFIVDWAKIDGGHGDRDIDPLLGSGDAIRVDPLVTSIRVQGAVRNPGLLEYAANRPVAEYIRLAGGFTERAAQGQVRVSRSQTGQILPATRSVEPGDFIWVPERKDVDPWAILRDVILVAGQVALVIVAFRR